MHSTASGLGQPYKTAHISRVISVLRFSVLYYLNLLRSMSRLAWDPVQTRDADETDGYGVKIQRREVSFWIENKSRAIPANYWAWTFVVMDHNGEIEPSGVWCDGACIRGLGVWVPKVILSTEPSLILY